MKLNKKKLIVEAIQLGLSSSLQHRKDRAIAYDNNSWNENLNFVYDAVMNLDGQDNLRCFKFNRVGYYLVAVFDIDSETLFCICGDKKFTALLNRPNVNSIHYTDAFCQLSHDQIRSVQTSLFGDCEDKIDSINTLLKKITANFELTNRVKRFAVIETRINHKEAKLLSVRAVYLNKNYEIVETDKTWQQFIAVDYSTVNSISVSTNVESTNENNQTDNYLSSTLSIKKDNFEKENEKKTKDK